MTGPMTGAEYRGDMLATLAGHPAVPTGHRPEVRPPDGGPDRQGPAGWMSVISLHGGGSPEAMRREVYRYYPLEDRRALALRLLDRGILDTGQIPSKQPGRCCPLGCQVRQTPLLSGPEKAKLAAE